MWFGFPLLALVVSAALDRVPRELEDSARLDGVGPFRRLRRLLLPLVLPALRPAIAIAVVLAVNGGGPGSLATRAAALTAGGAPEAGAVWALVGWLLAGLVVALLYVRRVRAQAAS